MRPSVRIECSPERVEVLHEPVRAQDRGGQPGALERELGLAQRRRRVGVGAHRAHQHDPFVARLAGRVDRTPEQRILIRESRRAHQERAPRLREGLADPDAGPQVELDVVGVPGGPVGRAQGAGARGFEEADEFAAGGSGGAEHEDVSHGDSVGGRRADSRPRK